MEVLFFHTDLRDYIDALDEGTHARVYKTIGLLEQFGYHLGLPQSRAMGNGLFELRIRGKHEVRKFYAFFHKQAVLLHAYIKKSQKTPVNELQIALNRKKQLTGI